MIKGWNKVWSRGGMKEGQGVGLRGEGKRGRG